MIYEVNIMNFFKELLKAIEFSLINGKAKFHIDFTSTFDLLNLFNNKEEEEERKRAEEEKKREEEAEEQLWKDGKDPSKWEEDDDEW